MQYHKTSADIIHARIPQGSLRSFHCQQCAAFDLEQVELREKVICTMNVSELRDGWTYELISCISATAIQLFSRHYLGGKRLMSVPRLKLTLFILWNFPPNSWQLQSCACFCFVQRKWEKVWVARKWDCSVVETLRDNIANMSHDDYYSLTPT